MNPLSMESMFLILSGVILASGILYWFWSHIQLTQKKVQLLENAVFELRGMLSPGLPSENQEPEYKDLEDDDWTEPQAQVQPQVPVSAPVEPVNTILREEPAHVDFMAELQAREVVVEHENENNNNNDNDNDNEKTVETEDNQTLEGLTLKVLRSMASQRGITGTSDMKKKDVIAALRGTV